MSDGPSVPSSNSGPGGVTSPVCQPAPSGRPGEAEQADRDIPSKAAMTLEPFPTYPLLASSSSPRPARTPPRPPAGTPAPEPAPPPLARIPDFASTSGRAGNFILGTGPNRLLSMPNCTGYPLVP